VNTIAATALARGRSAPGGSALSTLLTIGDCMTTDVAEVTENQTQEPEGITERQQAMLELNEQIIAQRKRVREAELALSDAKEELKCAKECLDSRQSHLNSLVDDLEDVRDGRPLQKSLPLSDGESAPEDVHGQSPVSVLKVPAGYLEKLEEAEVETVADLEAFMAAGKLTPGSVKGLGESAIDKITDALAAYRAECPIPVVADAGAESASAIDDEVA